MKYQRAGEGAAVVLVHSLGADRSMWRAEAERLQRRYTVVSVDLPGHGESPAPSLITCDGIARELAQIIRTEDLAPAVIVGHSLGGTIAAWVPLVDTGVARAVVISDSSIAELPFPEKDRNELRAQLVSEPVATLRSFYGRIAQPAQIDRLVETARRVPAPAFMGYLDAAASQAIADGGRGLTLPVLVQASPLLVANPHDRDAELARAGYANVADLTFDYFAGARHWIVWDQPAAFAASLDAFLARLVH